MCPRREEGAAAERVRLRGRVAEEEREAKAKGVKAPGGVDGSMLVILLIFLSNSITFSCMALGRGVQESDSWAAGSSPTGCRVAGCTATGCMAEAYKAAGCKAAGCMATGRRLQGNALHGNGLECIGQLDNGSHGSVEWRAEQRVQGNGVYGSVAQGSGLAVARQLGAWQRVVRQRGAG